MSIPSTITEYAFSGSLCRIHKFETVDGLRYCLTIFSLSDYKHLHFPHEEYKYLINKLYALQYTQAIFPSEGNQNLNDSVLSVTHIPFDENFKIKFGKHTLTIGSVTAFGLVKSSPFTDVDVFHINKNQLTCDTKWDICTCRTCSVFKRLIDYEATALTRFLDRKPENIILFQE